jgi:hypothetical protein
MPTELRPIPGYTGLYSITRDGRVFAHERTTHCVMHGKRITKRNKPKWLKTNTSGTDGHHRIILSKPQKQSGQYRIQGHSIQALVMLTYGPAKPPNAHRIDHIDENKANNHVSNLEWVTPAVPPLYEPTKPPSGLRPILGYEDIYSITCDGRVYSHERTIELLNRWGGYNLRRIKPKWLKAATRRCPDGYHRIHLYQGGQSKAHFVHALVLTAYGPPKPSNKHQVNHKDLNKSNNHCSNLEWKTNPENLAHARANGHYSDPPKHIGTKNINAKLTEKDVLKIRKIYVKGRHGNTRVLAKKFGVSMVLIQKIIKREIWRHI